MEENKQATLNEPVAKTHPRHFTIFDAFPVLISLAVAAFFAENVAKRFGALASVAAFLILSVLGFCVVGYAFHILYAFVSWFCRRNFGRK
jgi:uncharacterized membrane protein